MKWIASLEKILDDFNFWEFVNVAVFSTKLLSQNCRDFVEKTAKFINSQNLKSSKIFSNGAIDFIFSTKHCPITVDYSALWFRIIRQPNRNLSWF